MKRFRAACLVCIFFVSTLPAEQTQTANDYYTAAMNAYKEKDYVSFVHNLRSVMEAGTMHPRVFYNLACGYSLLHDSSEALKWLNRIADLGISYPIEEDPDLSFVRNLPEFREVVARFAQNERPVIRSKTAFTISDPHFMPEGIAYDPGKKRFFAGSILNHKIAILTNGGNTTDFSAPEDGLWSVLGMSLDPVRKTLWASSSTIEDLDEKQRSISAIFKYDLQTRKLIKSYPLPANEKHGLGDVITNKNGDAFTTDSVTPAIYRIDHRSDRIETFPVGDIFRSPQGLCLSADDQQLFVADYVRGLFVIDLKTRQYKNLAAPLNATVAGIDGLYCYNGALIATQNGFTPNRVLKVKLNAGNDRIEGVNVLEAVPPANGEITLGTIVGDDLFFVSNSQLTVYLQNRDSSLKPAVVRRLSLK